MLTKLVQYKMQSEVNRQEETQTTKKYQKRIKTVKLRHKNYSKKAKRRQKRANTTKKRN